MKAKKLILAVLFVLGLLSASLSSISGSTNNDIFSQQWKMDDTSDSNPIGGPIPPIGH
jgi:hypothetical protein